MGKAAMTAREPAAPLFWPLAAATPPAAPFVALVPGAEVALHRLDIPARIRGAARLRVARAMLAPVLAARAEGVEAVPLPAAGRDWSVLMVAERARLAEWAGALPGGARCLALVPDYLSLPHAPDAWVLRQGAGGVVLARNGADAGFAAEPDLAAALLRRWAGVRRPGAVLAETDLPGPVADALTALDLTPVQDPAAIAGLMPPRLADLRLADLRGTAGGAVPGAALWRRRWVLAALAGAFVLYCAGLALETRRLTAMAETDRAAAEALVRRHILPAGPLPDLRRQVERALAAGGGAEAAPGAVALLHRAAGVIAASPLRLDMVALRPETGMILSLTAPGFAEAEALVADLAAAGLAAEVRDSAVRAEGGVELRLHVEAGR